MEALNREQALPKLIDPTGRKWVIKGERGTALVQARPDPDRADAAIPKEFSGRWTSPTVLKEKIEIWLNRKWDECERAQIQATRREYAEKVEQKTAEESLAELPQEVKDTLGDILETHDAEEDNGPQEATRQESEASPEVAESEDGRGSESKQEKEAVDYTALNYAELLAVAKEHGITAKKKVEILEQLNAIS